MLRPIFVFPHPFGPVLDALARDLPFPVDDYAAAGRTYAAWRDGGAARDGDAYRTVSLWAYVYVQRHLAGRFARERTSGPADLDEAITRAFGSVMERLASVDDPTRFAHYVSVVCKNTVIRHRERRRETVEADDHVLPADDAVTPSPFAADVVRADVRAALDGLPESVREVARLRVLDGLDYDAIAARTGRPVASVRTYAARACARLREDPRLRDHHYDDVSPPVGTGPPPDG